MMEKKMETSIMGLDRAQGLGRRMYGTEVGRDSTLEMERKWKLNGKRQYSVEGCGFRGYCIS